MENFCGCGGAVPEEPPGDFCHSGCYIPAETDAAFTVMPRWGGHQRTSSAAYAFDGMRRGNLGLVIWQYTLDGCGAVETDGKRLPVRPGEAFLLTIPEKHRYYLPEDPGYWEFLYLSVSGGEAVRLAGELRKHAGSVSERYASAETVQLARQIIRYETEDGFADPAAASSLAYRFLMSLFSGSHPSSVRSSSDPVWAVHQYCLKHLSEAISVDELAAFTGYSRSHFCRVFRARSGRSPHEYIMGLRMRMALRMLQRGEGSVKEIANACGFGETGYFCRVFRRFHGTTPARFREKPR